MAKWRALHKQISLSTEVNDMSEFAQLLFDRALIHSDDWGVVTGDARQLKWLTMPGTQRPPEDFEAALEEMVKAGLIWWYWPEGQEKPLVQFICFDDYQPKTLIGNRSDPKLPIHHGHPEYANYPDFQWNAVKGWKKLENNESSKSKSRSSKGRDKNLDHAAFKKYREILCHSVSKAQRSKLVKCAEEFGMAPYIATLEMWRDRRYNPDNITGICGAVEREAKSGKSRQPTKQLTSQQEAFKRAAEEQTKRRADETDAR